jgi:hypothetical protein
VRRRRATALILTLLALSDRASGAADRATICKTDKMVAAGALDACLLRTIARATRAGVVPDLSKCQAKFNARWARAEAKAAGACPTSGDAGALGSQVLTDVAAVIAALTPSGPTTTSTTTTSVTSTTGTSAPSCGFYPGCGGTCSPGLSCWATITAGPSQSCLCLPTGSIPCAGTGGSAFSGPHCGGACPAGQVCSGLYVDDSSLSLTCGCIPSGSTPCISTGQPTCGGACPTGTTCGPDPLGLFSCRCQ